MKPILVATLVLVGFSWQLANAEEVPSWIKNNAKWWAEGIIDDKDFVQGIQYLVNQEIIKLPETAQGETTTKVIPSWVKNNAKWWAEGIISDSDFIKGLQYLIEKGIMVIEQNPVQTTQKSLDPQLESCKQKETPRAQYECEKEIKMQQEITAFKNKAQKHVIGPTIFYYAGATVEKSGEQDIVNLKFLVENSGSEDNVTLYCTGPAACNYDISDGQTTYKYSSQDFTSGQIVLKPGQTRMFNMLFGPAIGYGSYVDFKFDPSKQYTFNVNEPWGSGSIPLNLK